MKNAEIYREAARLVEEGKREAACGAIGCVINLNYAYSNRWPRYLRAVGPFRMLYEPTDCGAYWWPFDDEGHDCRILALCFMAAVVEFESPPQRKR